MAGKSSATMTAVAFVFRAAAAYFGFETNVKSPGPACSIPLRPVISVSADPFSIRACTAEAIAESFIRVDEDAPKSYTRTAPEQMRQGRAAARRRPPSENKASTYCTTKLNVAVCVVWFGAVPLTAVTVTGNVPTGVPVTTLKFVGLDAPPPGEGFVTTTGNGPRVDMSF